MNVGISGIGLATSAHQLKLDTLAEIRHVDPAKYHLGLGCDEMSLCAPEESVITLAVTAAQRALENWGGDVSRVGLLVVGTETAQDMSRPLSSWVAEELGLGPSLRSYEVKHACYGGTVALRQALEWKASGAAGDKVALVVAADVALYAPADPGEPTQGAGAAAMVVDSGEVARVSLKSYAWSKPAFDFWRPVGESFPQVDGPYSLDCYKEGAQHCFQSWLQDEGAQALQEQAASSFHVPFPKMVKKAFFHVAQGLEMSPEDAQAYYDQKIVPHMTWNRRTGNTYTASLWFSVAHALTSLEPGQKMTAFSYGSGAGAELLLLERGPWSQDAAQALRQQIEADLDARQALNAAQYLAMRQPS